MKIKAALIVDHLSMTQWQSDALAYAAEYLDVQVVLNCTNTATKKRYFRHFAYYVLNVLSLRNNLTRLTSIDLAGRDVIHFESLYEGAWQRIPSDVLAQVLGKL